MKYTKECIQNCPYKNDVYVDIYRQRCDGIRVNLTRFLYVEVEEIDEQLEVPIFACGSSVASDADRPTVSLAEYALSNKTIQQMYREYLKDNDQ
jgi:hypothetical protein